MPRRTAIGLDIGTSVVRAVELSYGRSGTTLERFGQLVLPPGAVVGGQGVAEDAAAAPPRKRGEAVGGAARVAPLRKRWRAPGLSHKEVVLGVANQRVIVRQLELPWVPKAE